MKNIIFGINGYTLTIEEKQFFREVNPVGFILFGRNCQNLQQIAALTANLRELFLGRKDVLIMIDQEGGRVARIKPPLFNSTPPAKYFGDIAKYDLQTAVEKTFANYKTIAEMLYGLGINVNCAPVADLYYPNADQVIGDRSFGSDISFVVELCKAVQKAFRTHKIQAVVKHIPGHGRTLVDSHFKLPVIDTPLVQLERSDFLVFKKLISVQIAMTAHVIYSCIDKNNPATTSPKVIEYIREALDYDGIIMTDDLGMQALQGSLAERTQRSLTAGCDLLLHCSGKMAEMREVAAAAADVTPHLAMKLAKLECF